MARAIVDETIETGKSLASRKEYLRAIEAFKQALEYEPGNTTALFELGKTYYMLRDSAQAQSSLEGLVAADPAHRDALMLLAKVYRETGRREQALRTLEDMIKRNLATTEVFRELGDYYAAEKDFSKAQNMYERVLQEHPDDFGLFLRLIQLYNYEGKYILAQNKIRELSPRFGALDAHRRNQVLNELEIAENRPVLASKPRIMLVTLTNRCNLKCPMCGRGKTGWDISEKLRDEVLSLLPYLELITWQGGEVFMYQHFKTILEETRKYRDLKQIIITNALLIDKDWAELLVANGNVDLTISIDSTDKQLYEKLRLGAEFEKLLENIRLIDGLRKKHSSRMILTLRCAIMGSNYREMESFLEFAKEHRFDVLLIFPISGDKDPENIFAKKDPEALKYLGALRPHLQQKANDYGIRLLNWLPCENPEPAPVPAIETDRNAGPPHESSGRALPGNEKKPEAPLCLRPWRQIAVNVGGYMFPECLCTRPVGNIFENSFTEIWNNEAMQEYRRNMMKGDVASCNHSCRSGAVPPEHLKFIYG